MGLDWNKLNQQKDALEEKLSKSGGARAKFWKPSPGMNRVRVMPGWAEEGDFSGQFWREVHQHWGVSEDQKGPILCPKNTPHLEGKCPICDLVAELKANKSDPQAQEVAKDIRAKSAFLLNVVDMADSEYTAQDVAEFKKARPGDDVPFEVGSVKVQVYACPSTVFNQILSVIQVNEMDITDPDEGHDVTIKKSGKGLMTRYETNIVLKPSGAPSYEKLPPLDEVGYQMSYDDMMGLLSSGVGASFSTLPSMQAPKGLGAPTESDDEGEDAAGSDELRAQMQAALNS